MLHLLLLDAAPATQGTPVSVYVTFVAAMLAALASLNATRVSANTARDMGLLASKTASESARIAAETAREIKATDYRHDFYKKIIERRLKAWEEAEQFIGAFVTKIIDSEDGKRFPRYCINGKIFDATLNQLVSMAAQTFWMGKEFSFALRNFHDKLVSMRDECLHEEKKTDDGSGRALIDDGLLHKVGKAHNKECALLLDKLLKSLGKQLIELPEVESFFEQFEHLGAQP